MNMFAARMVPYIGAPVEVDATIISQARLAKDYFRHVWPHLSADETRDEAPLGPVKYALTAGSVNHVGGPALVFQQLPPDPEGILKQCHRAALELDLGRRTPDLIRNLVQSLEASRYEPKTGIDPSEYMHGRFPQEVRATSDEYAAGSIKLYFENDNPGIIRSRQLVLNKDALTPDVRGSVQEFLGILQRVANTPAEPRPKGDSLDA